MAVGATTLTPTATAGTIATKRMTSTAEAKIDMMTMTTKMMMTMTTITNAVSKNTAIMRTPLFPSSARKLRLPRKVDRVRNPPMTLATSTVSASRSINEAKSEAAPRHERMTSFGEVTCLEEAAAAGGDMEA